MTRRPPRFTLWPYRTRYRSRNLLQTASQFEDSHLRPTPMAFGAALTAELWALLVMVCCKKSPANGKPIRGFAPDRNTTRLHSSHQIIAYAPFCFAIIQEISC